MEEAQTVVDATAGMDNPYEDITSSKDVTAVPYDGTPGAFVRDGKMFVHGTRANGGNINILTEPQLKMPAVLTEATGGNWIFDVVRNR